MDDSGINLAPILSRRVRLSSNLTSTSSTPTREVFHSGHSHSRVAKRASQACQNCRLRKVKCNLDATGISCANCRADEVECVAVESQRSRKSRRAKRLQLPAYTSPPSQITSLAVATTPARPWYPQSQSCTQVPTSHISTNPQTHPVFSAEPRGQDVTFPTEPPSSIDTIAVSSNRVAVNLPASTRGPRKNLGAREYQILEAQGALTVPETSLRDELLVAFVLYVHPYMPVLDLQKDLLDPMYLQQKGSGQCSLLLFQAVMFAASAFVDVRLLEGLGFRSRRAARKALYFKVKLLYDFDWETDRITIIQSLLLLNYWYLCPEDQKDPWHWLGVCLSLGTSIGLNNHSQHLKLPPAVRRLWRRVWWMCVLRDRTLAITTHKPLRIREDDINIPLLTLGDFETEPVSSYMSAMLGSTLLCNPETRITLARLCIEKVKLSLYAARVLTQTYTVIGHATVTTDTVMLSWPKRDSYALSEAVKLHHDLEQWQSGLPNDCVFSTNLSEDVADAQVLHVHRATLHMFLLITKGLLYYPYLRTRTDSPSLNQFLETTVRPYLERKEIIASDMAELMLNENLVRFLPPLAVTFFLTPLVRLIGEIKCSRNGFRDKLEYQFRQCNRAILQLRESWPIADSACVIVEGLLSRAQPTEVSSATSAVFLDKDQPEEQTPVIDSNNNQPVIPDYIASTSQRGAPITLPRPATIASSNVAVGEGISFPSDVFDEIVWSDLEPWFDQTYSPTEDLLWMDLAMMDYDSLNFPRPGR